MKKYPQLPIEERLEQFQRPQKFDDNVSFELLQKFIYTKGRYTKQNGTEKIDGKLNENTLLFSSVLFMIFLWENHLFGSKPLTDKVTAEQFDLLLKSTKDSHNQDLTHNKIEQWYVLYSLPQSEKKSSA